LVPPVAAVQAAIGDGIAASDGECQAAVSELPGDAGVRDGRRAQQAPPVRTGSMVNEEASRQPPHERVDALGRRVDRWVAVERGKRFAHVLTSASGIDGTEAGGVATGVALCPPRCWLSSRDKINRIGSE
jgi:hypothetical protein